MEVENPVGNAFFDGIKIWVLEGAGAKPERPFAASWSCPQFSSSFCSPLPAITFEPHRR